MTQEAKRPKEERFVSFALWSFVLWNSDWELNLPILCRVQILGYVLLVIPRETEGYGVELVCPSVCPSCFISIGWKLSILEHFKNCRYETFFSYARHFVHASLVWRNWVRAMKFYKCINQCPRSCLVKVSSISNKNCRFWRDLNTVDFSIFFPRCQALCAREFCMKELN